jgi:hypothetical protein
MPRSDIVENGQLVNRMSYAVADGEKSIKHVPLLIKEVIDTGAWQKRLVGKLPVEHKTFRDFIVTAPAQGMGWSTPEDIKQVEALLRYSPDVLQQWVDALKGKHGGDRKSEEAPIKNDNIRLEGYGTSLGYTLDRLKREHSDLYAKVVAGDMTANAAAISAGFRKKPTPFETILKLLPKLSDNEWQQVVRSRKKGT